MRIETRFIFIHYLMMGLFLSWFSMSLFSDFAYSECEPVDLRKPGYSMNQGKARDQGDLGVCYAHTAIKVMEAKLKKSNRVPSNFHGSIVAAVVKYEDKKVLQGHRLAYRTEIPPKEIIKHFDGGYFCNFMQQLKKDGLCSEAQVEGGLIGDRNKYTKAVDSLLRLLEIHWMSHRDFKKEVALREDVNIDIEDIHYKKIEAKIRDLRTPELERLEAIGDPRAAHLKKQLGISDLENLQLREKNFLSEIADRRVMQSIRNGLVKQFNLNSLSCPNDMGLEEIMRYIVEIKKLEEPIKLLDPFLFLNEVVNTFCLQKALLEKEEANTECIEESEKSKFASFISEEFKNGTEAGPIPIDFNAKILIQKGFRGSPTDNLHSALIIGRKKTSTGCSYLIENSWGTTCKEKYPWECENGDLWIDETDLFANTHTLISPFVPTGSPIH